jgi:hypothetical protein
MDSDSSASLKGSSAGSDEDFSPEAGGIMKRRCTDVAWLLVFGVFLWCQGYIAVRGFREGNLDKLTRGLDWKGRLCGVDPNVSGKPLLYWCGNGSLQTFEVGGQSGEPVQITVPESLDLETPICVEKCPRDSEELVYCPTTATVSKDITGEPPELTMVTTIVQEVAGQAAYPTVVAGGRLCLPDVASQEGPARELLEELYGYIDSWIDRDWALRLLYRVGNLADDVPNNLYLLSGICAGAFVLSFAYLLLLRFVAKLVVFVMLAVLPLGFGLLGAAFILTAHDLTGHQALSPIFDSVPDHTWAMVISDVLGVMCLLPALISICICCLRDTVETVVGCIRVAVECIFDMPTLLIEPVLGAALKLAILSGLLLGLAYLVSLGTVEGGTVSLGGTTLYGLHRSFTYTEEQQSHMLFYIFGIFWIMEVCDACQQFTISYAVVLWYYKPKPKRRPRFPAVRGFLNAICLHLGTLALGALLVATTQLLRLVLGFVKRQAQASGSQTAGCLASCCMYCLSCFKNCLEFINKNAYVDVAIRSSNFVPAALHVFKFVTQEVPAIALLNGACWIAQLGGVLSVSLASGCGVYLLVTLVDPWVNTVSAPVLLAVLSGMYGVCVSTVFMWVFDQCSDTLLYVFADNRKRSPETVSTYAPKTLSNLVDRFEPE